MSNSLSFEDFLENTKSNITYENQWSTTEIISIKQDSNPEKLYFSSVDSFLEALGLTSESTTIEDEETLITIQENINSLNGDCNFYLTSDSPQINTIQGTNYEIISYVYQYTYNIETSSTSYGDKTTTYYLNLKASTEENEDTNELQIEKNESNSTIETNTYSSTLSLVLTINYQKDKEEEEEPQEVEVTTSEYGSFPSGTSSDYCTLLLYTNKNYVQERGAIQSDLDNWAVDYLNKLNEYALSENEDPYTIASSYYGYDSSAEQYYVLVEKTSTDQELETEWQDLYGTEYNLQNTTVISNEKECYKVYVAGWAQLVGFDDMTLIGDQGGSTERAFYSYPNGYYVLIGDELRLFILDKIARIDYEENADTCTWYPITEPDNGQTLSLTSREIFDEGKYYFYIGKRAANAGTFTFPIDHSDTSAIIQNAANLRSVLVSNSVLELETFSSIANPTNGFILSDNLMAIGRYSFQAGGSSIVKIFSQVIEYIGEQAFPATANTQIIMCKEEQYETISLNSTSYIDLPATVIYIGAKAFYGLSIGILNEEKCASLSHVGIQAFAAAPTMKTIYLNYNTLDINDSGELIYLPDAIEYSVGTHSADSSYYNGSGSNSDKSNSMTQATFGMNLSGYTVTIN